LSVKKPEKWSVLPILLTVVSAALILVSVVLFTGSFTTTAPTFLAGLVGAAIGAGGSVLAQVVSARASDRRTEAEWDRRVVAESAAVTRATEEAARATGFESSSRLLDKLTRVHKSLQESTPTIAEAMDPSRWEDAHWGEIWTAKRSLMMDKRAILIVDRQARESLRRIVRLLDQLPNLTNLGSPVRVSESIRDLALGLTFIGVEIVATYMRNEAYSDKWDDRLMELQGHFDNYLAWETHEVERSIAEAEAQAG
jgi:hypothetical protein